MALKKLPVGIQTFSEIRNGEYIYVDKTQYIHQLITTYKANFLSRPRRFGKSMTLSTIKAIYQGEKQYFEGLWIEDKWNWTKRNPVVHIAFNRLNYKDLGLPNVLFTEMKENADSENIYLGTENYVQAFEILIKELFKKYGKVVLLIDEYDKPIIDYLERENLSIAKENRSILRNFYSILKEADPYIEFFLMTGVSKFSQTGIFSHLNHLYDLTFARNFVNLVGYTPNELTLYFNDWLIEVHKHHFSALSFEEFMEQVQKWYNGYSWDGKNSVYNPYSILLFLGNASFKNHWFATGTPTFLIYLIRQQQEFLFNDILTSGSLIESYDIENLNLKAILLQTGYLTIKHIDHLEGLYTLSYPNREVEQSMSDYLLQELTGIDRTTSAIPIHQIKAAFNQNDLPQVIKIMNGVLKDVPNPLIRGKKENFYHAVVHIYFHYLGLMMDSEVFTSDGRMDAVVKTQNHIYILEFKLNQSAEKALEQIKEKRYAEKYASDEREILLIGINFNSRKKGIGSWKVEKYSN